MKCSKCSIIFPDKFYSPFVTNEGTLELCPECVLIERNKIHRLPSNTPLTGKLAKELYSGFIKWKENRK